MTRCDRCRKETDETIMSMFNTDILCLDCQEAEEHDPRFEAARQAEEEACRRGDFNFPGIGIEVCPVRALLRVSRQHSPAATAHRGS